MLRFLKTTNVGPSPSMELVFGQRLNLLTGDNGLGKSFILDLAWWSLTRKWPGEVNSNISSGLMARPNKSGDATIDFGFTAKSKPVKYSSTFDRQAQAWTGKAGRPSDPGLVLYAQVDGSFAVWDPARNYWRQKGNVDVQDRPPAYVFSASEVWNGFVYSNGLIKDWALWQSKNGDAFRRLCAVLEQLSASEQEQIRPGHLVRVGLDDPRDIPTLQMPYGEVPVLHASAGIRRILALAYLLVWAWEEHLNASQVLDQAETNQIVFLIDEIEAHLHPFWQQKIIAGLLAVMKSLSPQADVQILTATHSPIILTSVEPIFDPAKDAWFDLDLVPSTAEPQGPPSVSLTKRPFLPQGDAAAWLTSEAYFREPFTV